MHRLLALSFLLLTAGAPATVAQPAPPADTLVLDVAEAIRLALDGSPEVAIERAGVDFATARARRARAARFLTEFTLTTGHAIAPGLDRNGSTLPDDQLYLDPAVRNDWEDPRPYNQFEVELLQPVWTGGELTGQIRAAEAAVEVERAVTAAKADEVALRAGELYVGLLAAEALEGLAAETGEALVTAGTELQRLLDDGDPDVTDADLFQLRLLEQEQRRQALEVAEGRGLAGSALARQLLRPGAPIVGGVLEPFGFEPEPLEAYFALALRHRPELRQAAAGRAAREALVRVARSGYFPKLFIGGSATGRYAAGRTQQGNPYISDGYLGGSVRFGVGIRQDLALLQTRAAVAEAEAELSEVRFQAEAAEGLVLFEVEQAYRDLAVASAALEARTEATRIAADWLRTEQINADLALGSVDDLTAAVRADLEGRAARIQAVQGYNVAVLRLLAAAGVLAERAQAGTLFGPSGVE